MSTLFFYGTLRHLPLLEIVLGRPLQAAHTQGAKLADHKVCGVKGADYPVIVAGGPGADGLIVSHLTETEVARLNFYEGGFDYELKHLEVQTSFGPQDAQVYFPLPENLIPAGEWSLTEWEQDWADLTCLAAHEAMSHFGHKTHAELDFMFPGIRMRAASKLAAQRGSLAFSPSGFHHSDANSSDKITRHAGYFTLQEHRLSHKNYDGTQTEGAQREVFVAADAALVLPYDPVRDVVLLVEQFRAGAFVRGEQKPWMLEPIAGRIDPGETPQEAALREAQEEANITIKRLHEAAQCYASPGCSTEFFHIFIGEADLPDDVAGLAGLDHESEDIKSYVVSYDRLMEIVDTQQAANAPLVLAALWLSRRRDELRALT